MSVKEIVELIAGVISVLSVIVIVTARLTWYKSEKQIRDLQNENMKLENEIDKLVSKQEYLIQSLNAIKQGANRASKLKDDIDEDLRRLAQIIQANASSILVPYPPSRNTRFVFLSITGPEANDLKHTLFDIDKGIAGYVFSHGKPIFDNHISKNPRWYSGVDKRIKFETNNLLCLPIKHGGAIIGVVQFLNKTGGFTEDDLKLAQGYLSGLTVKVAEFTQRIENFDILGLAHSEAADNGTIIVADLTNSSSLLKGAHPLPLDEVVMLMNEYLEKLTDIGLEMGGIIDKFQWDGFIMSFNVIKRVPNHQQVAVNAAVKMNEEFERLKHAWQQFGFPVGQIFNRIAISSGIIHEVHMGPPQYRQRTVIGDPVIVASVLCAQAPRDANVIYIDPAVKREVKNLGLEVLCMPPAQLGKAYGLIQEAFLLKG